MRIRTRINRPLAVRRLLPLCLVCAAALAGSACSGAEKNSAAPASEPATPAEGQAPASAVDASASAEQVAMGFMEAYGAFDADQAITYLADGADISLLIGSVGPVPEPPATVEDLRLLLALLQAEDYKQILRGCEDMGSGEAGTFLTCSLDFHKFGQGPFNGSYFGFTVRDGKIVEASKTYAIDEYSPQVWEPFHAWVGTHYPQDLEIMYTGGGSGVRLTEASIRLWEQHRREWVAERGQSTTTAETSS